MRLLFQHLNVVLVEADHRLHVRQLVPERDDVCRVVGRDEDKLSLHELDAVLDVVQAQRVVDRRRDASKNLHREIAKKPQGRVLRVDGCSISLLKALIFQHLDYLRNVDK